MYIHIQQQTVETAIYKTFISPSLPGEFFRAKLHRFLKNEIYQLFKQQGLGLPLKGKITNIKTKTIKKYQLNTFPGYNIVEEWGTYPGIKEYNLDFCLNQYAHSTDHPAFYHALESYIDYKNANDKCFGNMSFLLPKKTTEAVHFSVDFPLKIVGYVNDVGMKKSKPFTALVGIFIDYNYLTTIGDRFAATCSCPIKLLTEEIEEYTAHIPIFQCQCCGKLYCCSCFENYYLNLDTATTFIAGYSTLHEHKPIHFKDKICQLCTAKKYPTKLPALYYRLIQFNHPNLTELLDVKNYLREKYGETPRATGYKGESLLYEVIAGIVGKDKILVHHRPEWLRGLEIDIYIPHLKIGFEYQGRQHYEPIKFFGGKEALEDLQYRDALKKELCKLNNVDLYEYRYDEEIYPDDILNIIQNKKVPV